MMPFAEHQTRIIIPNNDSHDGYDEMMHASKHKQRENKLVEHIGDKCKEIKNLRTSNKKFMTCPNQGSEIRNGLHFNIPDAICPS